MKYKSFLMILIMFFLLCGCGNKGDAPEGDVSSGTGGAQGYHFIFVCPIIENEYWESCIEGIRKADAELGTVTEVIGPRTADNFSVEIIDYMREAVAAKPDGIMAYAGIEGLFPLIEEAAAQGIPVLALDSDAPGTSRVAYVGTDSYNAGYKAGRMMVEFTGGSAKVGLMVSSLSAEKEMQVVEAFQDAVGDYDIKIVATEETDANPDVAEQKAREMLSEHPEITAMFNTAGYNVTGAARVKKEQGLNDLVLIGFDDVEENLQFVREGVINGILVQRIEQVGYQGVYLMKECVEKDGLPKDSYDTGTIEVTLDNVDTYNNANPAAQEGSKIVRVGYYSGDTAFQDGYSDEERKSGYAYEYYQAIAAQTGWKYEYVYGSRTEIMDLLAAGDVDIAAGVYRTDSRVGQGLFAAQDMGLDGQERYFVVNQDREDLLTELDYAMEQITEVSPDFKVALWQKYYGQANRQQVLNDREKEWLARKGKLRVGYVRYNMPFSEQTADGLPTGVVKDLMDIFADYLRVEIESVCYEDITMMEEALKAGEIDAAFPMYFDLWLSENKGLRQTDALISDRVMVVYSGSYTDDLMSKVALSISGIGQSYYMETYYPDSEVTFYDSRESAFDAILAGDERCFLGCSSILQHFLAEHSKYQDLHIAYLDTSEDFGFAVSQDDSILAGILNKAIHHMDDATITSALMRYSAVETEFTLSEVVQRYFGLIIGVLSAFFALLLWAFIAYRIKTRHFNEEQAKTQASLKEALEVAKSASEAKTNFLSSMSHDIRTPMNAIIGMTTIATKHLDDRNRIEDCLEKISLSSHHLLTLINNVLDISKIESGKLVLNPVSFSLRDTVTALVNIIRPQIVSKGLDFDIRTHGLKYETIYADELRINQIFINILSNAVKYTPQGGRIDVDLQEELLDDKQVKIIYVVKDTGIGMSREFMDNMYEIFTRAKDSRIDKIQGTGLGLSIVKQIVDIMDGTIECESEEGKGTKFTVTLEVSISETVEENLTLPPIRVLLVDDDEIFLGSARESLGEMGVSVDTASSGPEALEMIEQKHARGEEYPVFIVDWQMPGMDGLKTIREIRNIAGSKVPIILISAYDWADIEENARGSGATGFISKLLFRSDVYEKLREALELMEKTETPEEQANHGFEGLHILIAEDNDLNWEIISELLAMVNISAERAENGQICVDMLIAATPGTYDMIFMDIQMPIMNGREAARTIRADEREYVNSIPIIAMTADAFAEDIAASLEAGMDGHVAKPVDMDKLFQEMRKVFAERGIDPLRDK